MYRIGWENSNIVLLRIPHPSGPGLGPGLGLGLAPAAAACSFPGFSFGQEILLFTRYFWSYGATFRFSKRVKVGTGTEPRGARPPSLSRSTSGNLSKAPPASYSSLLDSSSKMYPASTPGLSVCTCLHAAQLNRLYAHSPSARVRKYAPPSPKIVGAATGSTLFIPLVVVFPLFCHLL